MVRRHPGAGHEHVEPSRKDRLAHLGSFLGNNLQPQSVPRETLPVINSRAGPTLQSQGETRLRRGGTTAST